MGKTYKDREKVGRPRVPEWARPKPGIFHKKKKNKDDWDVDPREDFFEELYEKDAD